MSKGESTRQTILERATVLARTVGLDGLTIGKLSDELRLSKSGLFAHFRSKENLQIEVIQEASRQFIEKVVLPALKKPRGEPRVRALFDRWLDWGAQEGGCVFVSIAVELDDRAGPARDVAVKTQRDWLDALALAARIAIDERHFHKDLDPDQFAFELHGIMLMSHFTHRFMRDKHAHARTKRAFESLIERSRTKMSDRR